MSFPSPHPGLVISYAYLWADEYRGGREEGVKDRPCAIVVARQSAHGKIVVTVVPITHTQPDLSSSAIKLPIKRHLCLMSSWDGHPFPIFPNKGGCQDEKFAGRCNDGDFGRFAFAVQVLAENLEIGIGAGSAQSRHVEGVAQSLPAAAYVGLAALFAAVAVHGREAGELLGTFIWPRAPCSVVRAVSQSESIEIWEEFSR